MGKQQRIPGTEGKSIKDLDRAAEAYVDVRDRRMALTKDEVKAQEKLKLLMAKHGLRQYRFDDLFVEVVETIEKVRVKRIAPDEAAE